MKKLLIIISLLFCSSVSAEWVLYHESSSGDKFWYEDERIKVRGDNAYVWSRSSYPIAIKGYKSNERYDKINCEIYSYKNLQLTWFMDSDWNYNSFKTVGDGEYDVMIPQSKNFMRVLADMVCKEMR